MKTKRVETDTSKVIQGDTVQVYRIGHGYEWGTVTWTSVRGKIAQVLYLDGVQQIHSVVYS